MKKHILLVDDDEEELQLFCDALTEAEILFTCTWARNGLHALKMLEYLIPDCIVLDYNMPKMNGLECLAQIKKQPHLDHVPVIMYSDSMDERQRAEAFHTGAANCIKKPSDMRRLPELLQPYLI